ncbi:glycosyltransferase family 2 protein [uncultured Microbacterium sp.]|uniref:glycosyltransferase family 2 protein n=1 Tax=uncultured Microbacterium sp. TaxID=191216 RepID=UPI002638593A|nr:glycosyltransferase family 2 protein [uncultured Microbacterium sp.]
MPRLSVIVPAYNAAATIIPAIRSSLRALPRDAEVVVLDDGSTDATAEEIGRIDDSRVRVLSRPNRGVAAALNELLSVTDSEFVARMDADDLVLPGRFRRQRQAVGAGADAVFTTVVTWGAGVPSLPRPTGIEPEDFPLHLLLTNPVAHSTLFARRSAMVDAGGYRSVPTEDYDLWLRMAVRGTRLRRLPLPGLAYRIHPGQVTASMSWRRSSWESAELSQSYSALAETLLGAPARRITSLSIADGATDADKRAELDVFSERFRSAAASHAPRARRALHRKLGERRSWLHSRLSDTEVSHV